VKVFVPSGAVSKHDNKLGHTGSSCVRKSLFLYGLVVLYLV